MQILKRELKPDPPSAQRLHLDGIPGKNKLLPLFFLYLRLTVLGSLYHVL